jgi:hypothetical protein
MKSYAYDEPLESDPVVVTESEVLTMYAAKFKEKLQKLKLDPATYTDADCIED